MESNNCPNCGAAITDEKCPYCGTTIFDFSAIDIDKPCFIKFKHGNTIMRTFVEPAGFTYEHPMDDAVLYADNKVVHQVLVPSTAILTFRFKVLPHRNEVLDRNDVLTEFIYLNETDASTKGW